ncbi:DAK2 domain-containing protein [Saccharopolyspora sp. 7B]|uniref:DAK2 domain-containing protein n=1 Tax=Saccharopolyspora sp. 7B TaxID=2877240 RepID=UPI0027E0E41E|nr:DAK2 domain-containing protein [Saccharopolyspora sp. 7B]
MVGSPKAPEFGAEAARSWARESVAALERDRAALDRINVYPVADGDTGTNLLHTMSSALAAVEGAPDVLGDVLGALAAGAVSGARGNSGMLLSQVLRGVAEQLRAATSMDGAALRAALHQASALAAEAIAEPVDGTMLSVLRAAAEGTGDAGDELGEVVRAATAAAIEALARTPGQLPALAAAGVVDAGGRGLVVLLDALHAVVHDGVRLAPDPPAGDVAVPAEQGGYAYEVMYLLAGAEPDGVDRLRTALGELGDCVSVVGDGAGAWAVHVHCDDIGGAIEAGVETGRPSRIRVQRFADQAVAHPVGQAVLACVAGDALAELFRAEGAEVLPLGDADPQVSDLVAAIERTRAAHVVLLPNEEGLGERAELAAKRAVRDGRDVVVVPTASPVQGLAALAVHDPARRSADDAVVMAEAAAATRRGELRIAESEALTWAGRCAPGDVLGLVDGEVVLVGRDFPAVARDLVDRMLTAGGELVTVLVGDRAPAAAADRIVEHLARHRPEVECACYPAGALPAALLLGVE